MIQINFTVMLSMSSLITNRQLVSYINYCIFSRLLAFYSLKKKKGNSHKPSLLNPPDWKTIPFTFANFSREISISFPITPSIVTTHHE